MIFEVASKSVNLEATPFTDNGYLFKSLHMEESLGRTIAFGDISFTSDGTNMNLIEDQEIIEIKLKQLNGITYNIKGFIHSREYIENEVKLNFICASKEFLTESRVVTFVDIDDALQTLYTWNTNITVKSDINNNLEINQNGQTDYELAVKLAQSYKYNTVFSFGLEGFMIKGLDGNPVGTIKGQTDGVLTTSYNFNYYKQLEIEPVRTDKFINIMSMINDQAYFLVHESYSILLENYLYNQRYLTELYTDFSLRYIAYIPTFKLGDKVEYKDIKNFPRKNYVVSRMIFDIDMNKIEVNVTFNGLDKK